MRCIGLLGGMSWESTAVYYRRMNEQVRDRLGGLHSANILLHSVDFDDIVTLQKAGDWDGAAARLTRIGQGLEAAGARAIVICTNTMHILADRLQAGISVPLLHIADVTGAAIAASGCRRPLLLATSYTMEQPFYRHRLKETFGLEAVVPGPEDRRTIHAIIFDELCQGVVREASRRAYLDIIERMKNEGIDCVIFGCTEIGLLLTPDAVDLPVFDSTILHSDAAVDFALAEPA